MHRCSAACGRLFAVTIAFAIACGGSPPTITSGECPKDILDDSNRQGGTCFEPAEIGARATTACVQLFAAQSLLRDPGAEAKIGRQTGKTWICYLIRDVL